MKHLLTDRTAYQNAWVVDDLMAAIDKWVNFFGVGPFYLLENIELANLKYRGQPTELNMSVGLAQAGPVQIELIQQHNDGPSVYRDKVAKGQSGFHHFSVFTHDIDADTAAFEAAGYATAFSGTSPDGSLKFAYYDTRKDFDVFTEVVTPLDSFMARAKMIAAAAENWDGKDPVRVMNLDGSYVAV